jgi:hypothetical protein
MLSLGVPTFIKKTMRSYIIGQYTYILRNNAQELTSYRFGLKYDTSRIRKYFLCEPRVEPGSLGWMTDALASSAAPPLIRNLVSNFSNLKICQQSSELFRVFSLVGPSPAHSSYRYWWNHTNSLLQLVTVCGSMINISN